MDEYLKQYICIGPVISFIFGIILAFNAYDTDLWIFSIELLAAIAVVIAIAVTAIYYRKSGKAVVREILEIWVLTFFSMGMGCLIGMVFGRFITDYLL